MQFQQDEQEEKQITALEIFVQKLRKNTFDKRKSCTSKDVDNIFKRSAMSPAPLESSGLYELKYSVDDEDRILEIRTG